jgi:hypothetical protein
MRPRAHSPKREPSRIRDGPHGCVAWLPITEVLSASFVLTPLRTGIAAESRLPSPRKPAPNAQLEWHDWRSPTPH